MYLNSNDRTSVSIQKWFQLWKKDSHPSIYCSNIICSRINTFIHFDSVADESLSYTMFRAIFHKLSSFQSKLKYMKIGCFISLFFTFQDIFFYTLHTMLNTNIFLTFVCWWPKLGCCVVFEQPCWKSTLKIYVQ